MRDAFSGLMFLHVIGFLLLTLSPILLRAQESQQQLNTERMRINAEIEATEKLLNSATSNKASTLSQINALELQIDARNRLIENLKKEGKMSNVILNEDITEKKKVNIPTEALLEEYVKVLRIQYRNKLLQRPHQLTTEDGKKHLVKNHYLNVYKNLLAYEAEYQDGSDSGLVSAAYTSQTSAQKIEEQEQEKLRLEAEMQALVSSAMNMTVQEQAFKQKLDDQHQKRESYNRAIEALLIKSMGQKNGTVRHAAVLSQPANLPEIADIERKRGFLPYPVTNYTITKIFGPQPHPEIPNITIDNKGIDLRTRDLHVNAIFDGVVAGISKVGDQTSAVIIRHGGDYYSVYSGLSSIEVIEGEFLSSNQVVGILAAQTDGTGELHFEFYRGRQRMNPKHWLKNN